MIAACRASSSYVDSLRSEALAEREEIGLVDSAQHLGQTTACHRNSGGAKAVKPDPSWLHSYRRWK